MREPAPRRRRPWVVTLPIVVVVFLGLGWSGLWLYAANVAEARVSTFLARQASVGRAIGCGTRSTGGYPFRIEVRCTDPSLDIASNPGIAVKAKDFVALVQVYAPNLVIAEVTGPLTIVAPGQQPVTA